MKIKVAFLPTSPLAIAGDVCIVVDVIRATTAIVTLFDAGSDRVFVGGFGSDVTKARAAVGETGVICAERDDGSPPLGFDHVLAGTGVARHIHLQRCDHTQALLTIGSGISLDPRSQPPPRPMRRIAASFLAGSC